MTNNESTINDASSAGPVPPRAKSSRLTLLIAIPVLVLALVAGIWFYQSWAVLPMVLPRSRRRGCAPQLGARLSPVLPPIPPPVPNSARRRRRFR